MVCLHSRILTCQRQPAGHLSELAPIQGLAFGLKCRIQFSRGNVIQIVAHRLESDADQNLEYLILTVSCGQEVLDRLRFHMSALRNDLLRERDKCF